MLFAPLGVLGQSLSFGRFFVVFAVFEIVTFILFVLTLLQRRLDSWNGFNACLLVL